MSVEQFEVIVRKSTSKTFLPLGEFRVGVWVRIWVGGFLHYIDQGEIYRKRKRFSDPEFGEDGIANENIVSYTYLFVLDGEDIRITLYIGRGPGMLLVLDRRGITAAQNKEFM